MFRKGYIFIIHNNLLEDRCPVIYYNNDYIYFKRNGTNLLDYVRQDLVYNKEDFEKNISNNMQYFKFYYVFTKNEDETFSFQPSKTMEINDKINKLKTTINTLQFKIDCQQKYIENAICIKEGCEKELKDLETQREDLETQLTTIHKGANT